VLRTILAPLQMLLAAGWAEKKAVPEELVDQKI
jgi:hypothetical protein